MDIEKDFSTVSQMLFGRPLSGIRQYGEWLLSRAPEARIIEKKSAVSGKTVYLPSAKFFLALGNRVVNVEEALKLGETMRISEKEVEGLTVANAAQMLYRISATTPEIVWGKNVGTEESCAYGPSQYCFRVACCWFSKFIAYSYWSRTSERLFGCSLCTDCSFCFKCYSSTKLTRCFEVNDSNSCSDSYFCHNCEDLRDCMFCFNTKGKRYAIGNVEVGKEEYMRIKRLVQAQIVGELEKTKSLKYDIYNIGAKAAGV